MNLLLALYMSGALVGLDAGPADRGACDREAAADTAAFSARGDPQFTVRCTTEADPTVVMALKLHPELRASK